ncbi:Spy/CpxP family protein refolding chaperone [Saccharicrinis carchari]|nr:Spy/CpxP family protein refolding chaperone [Saccharicrinis carchari]
MKKKHYIIIIVALVVLNVFSWRIWWESPSRPESTPLERVKNERRSKSDRSGIGFFEQRLNLSQEQKQAFGNLKQSYFSQLEQVKDSMSVVRKKLISSIGSEMDEETREILFDKMAKHKLKMERMTIEHFNDMRRLCSEEQKPVFDTIMVRMMERSSMFKDSGRKGRHRRDEGRRRGR